MPHIPRLRFRPTSRADLAECAALLPAWLGLDARLRKAVVELWGEIFDEPGVRTTVMEDLALPSGQRIQGWGVGIFLREAWVRQANLETRPSAYVNRQIYTGLTGGSLTLMSDEEVGTANAAGGIHFFNFYTQRRKDLSDPYVLSVFNIANEAFRFTAAGVNYRVMYFETSGQDAPAIAAAGFPVRAYADESALEKFPPAERPVFFSVTREEAKAGLPGTSVRHVFEHHPPMFRFSLSQRRLMWLALFDDSDSHLTERLDVSVHGLKKLWRGIYERIEDRSPEFFGDSTPGDDGRRGPEKRRQVLGYVRQRPEELRPWMPERD